jgi:hypothetical protein
MPPSVFTIRSPTLAAERPKLSLERKNSQMFNVDSAEKPPVSKKF